jgi:TolA-binding protein
LAWALAQQDKTKDSDDAFARLTKEHPGSPLAAEALYHLGVSAFKAGNFKKAAVAYHEAWQKAGKSELGEKATHKLAWSFYRLNNYASAQQTFNYECVTWPNGPLAADAAFMEGESLLMQKKPAEALASYEKAIAKTDGETAARAQFQIGRIQFDRKDYQGAKKSFLKVSDGHRFPRWQAEAMYEAARCCDALGEKDAAIRQYAELVQKFPQSDKSPLAKQRMEELRK